MIANIITQDGISCVVDGQSYMVSTDHPRYNSVKKAVLNGDEDGFKKLYSDKFRLQAVISTEVMAKYNVEIKDGMLYYNGDAIHTILTRRILDLYDEKLPVDHLMEFLCNVMENPSYNSREQLYGYLERHHIPITEDGCFLAYKYVNSDFSACHRNKDGTYNDNTPGQTVSMSREDVDDNTNNGCSAGLHVGSFGFVKPDNYNTVVICKVNPKDVVSVPHDCDFAKIRVCEYTVLSEYKHELVDNHYSSDGEETKSEMYCWDCGETEEYCDCDETAFDYDEKEDVMFLDVDDLLEGQKIAFVYNKVDGTVSDRVVTVHKIFPNRVVGYVTALLSYRTFQKKGMSEVTLLS